MSSVNISSQLRMANPPKLKKGDSYTIWISEFKTFIDRYNTKLTKMYTKDGHESLPSKQNRDIMLVDVNNLTGGQSEADKYKETCKLNNEAQLLLRSAMDKSTSLSKVLEHAMGERATVIEKDEQEVPSAYHQKIFLDERYGKKGGSTEQDEDKDKWENMSRKNSKILSKFYKILKCWHR